MGFVPFMKRALTFCMSVGAMSILAGCPGQDVGLALLTNPDVLDFNSSTNQITLNVRTNFSTTRPEPLTVQASDPWIMVDQCMDASEGCLVGSITESINLQVRVDRTKTVLGTNRGTLTLEVPGASRVTLDVVAEDGLDPDFSVATRRVSVGAAVQFVNTSSTTQGAGAITGYQWDFGDGTTSTLREPQKSYGTPGVYSVSLTINTANGSETFTRQNYVVVGDPQPLPNFTGSPREIFSGETVQFSDLTTSIAGPIISRQWNFGDGGTSNVANPSHQYTQSGIFNVSLTVQTEFASATETKVSYILVKRKGAPEAAISISTVNPSVGDVVQFNDASDPGSSGITRRVWEFGDGEVSTETNPTHVYRNAGSYTVKLTVFSAHGFDSATLAINLDFAAPRPDFEVLETNPSTCSDPITCPEAVQFVDRSSPGSGRIIGWLWDFGDGNTSREQNPRHGYNRVGTFDVSLTITTSSPTNNVAAVTKQDIIVTVNPPRPDFSVSTQSAFTNAPVTFTNRTRIGTEPNVTYQWDFDGNEATVADRSTEVNPSFQYSAAGTYNPTLTASSPTRAERFSRTLIVDTPTVADFIASTRTPTTATAVQFTDRTSYGTKGTGGAVTATAYRWDFGDGSISTERNPSHTYRVTGVYPVSLTVTYLHSGSGVAFTSTKTQPGFITVGTPTAPVANFTVKNTDCLFVGDRLEVSATTSTAIDLYQWDFGDPGSPDNTAGTPNASHLYDAPGTYTVTLTVIDDELQAPFDRSTRTMDVVVSEETALDAYVREDDPAYAFSQVGNAFPLSIGIVNFGTAYNLYLTSGTWRDATDIDTSSYDGRVWKHNLTIIEPQRRVHDTAVLVISGGSRTDTPPDADGLFDVSAPQIALATGAPIVVLDDVPAQPIRFRGETADRTEDALIAYSFDQFLDDFDTNQPIYPEAGATDPWPALLPMARAAVRAMDATQEFMDDVSNAPTDFIVTGFSKRGWTTWLAGLTDCRVRAIAPGVIDLLNTDESMIHHQRSLANQPFGTVGGFSQAVQDYEAFDIFGRLGDAENDEAAQALLSQVDPYEYRERAVFPKLLLNASGDEFFLSDSAQFYIDDLPGETSLSYIPNVGHGLGGDQAFDIGNDDSAVYVLTSWILGVLQGVERPKINWAFPNDNTIVVDLDDPSGESPQVVLWSITVPGFRDFRKFVTDTLNRSWSAQTLSPQSNGTYVGTVSNTPNAWTAYYIQVRFDSDAQTEVTIPGVPQPEFVFSTPIRITPDVYPSTK